MGLLKYELSQPLDSPERTLAHRDIILNKPFLNKLYREWYAIFISELENLPDGKIVEIGSGGGFLKRVNPKILISDILPLADNDLTFSALDMPFEPEEVSCILMINTFHHLPDSKRFLQEADRVLTPGGKIIMIEPANSLWGRFIYQNFHHEPFQPDGPWKIPESGPLSGANGALPWIVFERDLELFKSWFPNFILSSINYGTALGYLLSGGVSFKSLVPGFSFVFFRLIDKFLSSISKQISMFMVIRVQKRQA